MPKKKTNYVNPDTSKKRQSVEKNSLVSPIVITAKKDRPLKTALNSRKINESCIKMRPHMPNFEEILDQFSTDKARIQNEPLWMLKIDIDYAYDQLKLSKNASRQFRFAIIGGNMNGYHRFKKRFSGLSDIRTKFK